MSSVTRTVNTSVRVEFSPSDIEEILKDWMKDNIEDFDEDAEFSHEGDQLVYSYDIEEENTENF